MDHTLPLGLNPFQNDHLLNGGLNLDPPYMNQYGLLPDAISPLHPLQQQPHLHHLPPQPGMLPQLQPHPSLGQSFPPQLPQNNLYNMPSMQMGLPLSAMPFDLSLSTQSIPQQPPPQQQTQPQQNSLVSISVNIAPQNPVTPQIPPTPLSSHVSQHQHQITPAMAHHEAMIPSPLTSSTFGSDLSHSLMNSQPSPSLHQSQSQQPPQPQQPTPQPQPVPQQHPHYHPHQTHQQQIFHKTREQVIHDLTTNVLSHSNVLESYLQQLSLHNNYAYNPSTNGVPHPPMPGNILNTHELLNMPLCIPPEHHFRIPKVFLIDFATLSADPQVNCTSTTNHSVNLPGSPTNPQIAPLNTSSNNTTSLSSQFNSDCSGFPINDQQQSQQQQSQQQQSHQQSQQQKPRQTSAKPLYLPLLGFLLLSHITQIQTPAPPTNPAQLYSFIQLSFQHFANPQHHPQHHFVFNDIMAKAKILIQYGAKVDHHSFFIHLHSLQYFSLATNYHLAQYMNKKRTEAPLKFQESSKDIASFPINPPIVFNQEEYYADYALNIAPVNMQCSLMLYICNALLSQNDQSVQQQQHYLEKIAMLEEQVRMIDNHMKSNESQLHQAQEKIRFYEEQQLRDLTQLSPQQLHPTPSQVKPNPDAKPFVPCFLVKPPQSTTPTQPFPEKEEPAKLPKPPVVLPPSAFPSFDQALKNKTKEPVKEKKKEKTKEDKVEKEKEKPARESDGNYKDKEHGGKDGENPEDCIDTKDSTDVDSILITPPAALVNPSSPAPMKEHKELKEKDSNVKENNHKETQKSHKPKIMHLDQFISTLPKEDTTKKWGPANKHPSSSQPQASAPQPVPSLRPNAPAFTPSFGTTFPPQQMAPPPHGRPYYPPFQGGKYPMGYMDPMYDDEDDEDDDGVEGRMAMHQHMMRMGYPPHHGGMGGQALDDEDEDELYYDEDEVYDEDYDDDTQQGPPPQQVSQHVLYRPHFIPGQQQYPTPQSPQVQMAPQGFPMSQSPNVSTIRNSLQQTSSPTTVPIVFGTGMAPQPFNINSNDANGVTIQSRNIDNQKGYVSTLFIPIQKQ